MESAHPLAFRLLFDYLPFGKILAFESALFSNIHLVRLSRYQSLSVLTRRSRQCLVA